MLDQYLDIPSLTIKKGLFVILDFFQRGIGGAIIILLKITTIMPEKFQDLCDPFAMLTRRGLRLG